MTNQIDLDQKYFSLVILVLEFLLRLVTFSSLKFIYIYIYIHIYIYKI